MDDGADQLLPQYQNDIVALPNPRTKPAVSSFVKGGIGLLLTANVDMVVAFSTAYWATWTVEERGEHGGYGVWKTWHCGRSNYPNEGETIFKKGETVCAERYTNGSFPVWYMAVQVLETLGLAGFLSSMIMLILYIFLPHWHKNKAVMSIIISISYSSGCLVAAGLFVFGFKVAEEIEELKASDWFLSWSFSLACTGFVLNQIAASVLVTENKRLSWTEMNSENEKDSDELQPVTPQTVLYKQDLDKG